MNGTACSYQEKEACADRQCAEVGLSTTPFHKLVVLTEIAFSVFWKVNITRERGETAGMTRPQILAIAHRGAAPGVIRCNNVNLLSLRMQEFLRDRSTLLSPRFSTQICEALFFSQSRFCYTGCFIKNKKCNPSDAAGNVATIVTNNEYFIKLYQPIRGGMYYYQSVFLIRMFKSFFPACPLVKTNTVCRLITRQAYPRCDGCHYEQNLSVGMQIHEAGKINISAAGRRCIYALSHTVH